MGQTTLTPLARATGLPTTTVQSVLSRLDRAGLVSVTKRKSRSAYEALDPVALRRILERQTEEVVGLIPHLQGLMRGESAPASIRVYQRERMAEIFHEALRAKEKRVYELVSAKDIQDILGEKFHFTSRRVKAGIMLNSLRVEAHEIKKYSKAAHARELREAKFLPREMTFRCSVLFWDDTVAFFTPQAEGLAWTVRSKALRHTFQQVFDLLWSVSRRMETSA